MDQLACMRTFVRVAEMVSFTRAAESLGLSRAVVSTQIADLERHLGARLFHRTTRRVSLTPDGIEYFERSKRILAEIDAADDAVKASHLRPQGRLRVDVPSSFGRHLLLPALPQFVARYPALSLEVQYNDRVIDLFEEQVDVVVRSGPVSDPNLIARKVCRTRLLTCASPEYLKDRSIPQDPEQLRGHQLIGQLSQNRRPRKWLFQRGGVRKQLSLPFCVSFSSVEAAVMAAARGTGIVQAIDMLVAGALATHRLQLLLPDWSAEGAPISIVYPVALRNSPKVRVFADFASGLLLDWSRRVDALLAPAD